LNSFSLGVREFWPGTPTPFVRSPKVNGPGTIKSPLPIFELYGQPVDRSKMRKSLPADFPHQGESAPIFTSLVNRKESPDSATAGSEPIPGLLDGTDRWRCEGERREHRDADGRCDDVSPCRGAR
jgi:hypothetical protein